MKDTRRRWIMIFLRLVLGGVFLVAGFSKLGATMQTLAAVYSYQIVVPDWVANGVAAGLPWIELALGGALVAGVFMPVVLVAAGFVLAAFTALTAQAWWRELPIDCGCFDFGSLHPALEVLGTPGGATLRNLVLLGLVGALAVLWRQAQRSA